MKFANIINKLFALVLIVAWIGYAVFNGVMNMPSIASAYSRNWGISNKLAAAAEAANGSVLYQDQFQNIGGKAHLMLQQQTLNGYSIVHRENGELSYANFYPYEFHDYSEPALQMQQLALAAEEQGTSLLFINCGEPFAAIEDEGVGQWANDLNPRSDAFLRALHGYGVDYLDSRVILTNSDLSSDEYTYRTEPHWTTQAAFEVYAGLVEELNIQGGNYQQGDFRLTFFSDCYLGKLGKIAGATYAGYDDFVLIEPEFETDFTMSYWKNDIHDTVRGDFGSTLLDRHWMESANPYENDMYSIYLTEVYPFRMIENHMIEDGSKVLVIGDSFMLPVAAFLATSTSELHLLSPYSLPEGVESLIDYVEDNEFDQIIVGLNPGTLYEGGFNFLTGIEIPELPQ